ncbi:ATP-binding cassette domain-containing protein [uncultured Clostridium sp.]|uniref:ABC transporter ATP-binding protein/permease n=1 Tax=uncultured Clostridium sp. TaxID=59620 RepID=UPI003216C975
MLVLKNISRQFNNVNVLKNLNLEFKNGLNFIVGPSGSGKSTLLKIISGMDKKYEGQVFYKGSSLKEFSEKDLNTYYCNTVGFIWQDFQLINHLSVEDNVKVVLQLSNLSSAEKDKKISDILKRLAIDKLAKKNVAQLSGGQKQRVAIARALVKDPEIIIADEPTGALDKKSSAIIMNTLKKISKERLVIVVTHDKSLIDNESNCFLLNEGRISQVSSGANEKVTVAKTKLVNPKLSFINAFSLSGKNFKGLFMKFVMSALILMLSSYFLLLNVSGTIGNEQENILNQLVKEKGTALRDLSIYSSAVGAGGTSGNDTNKPNLNIEQDISNVLKKYKDDPRVEFFAPLESVGNMTVNIDGVLKEYKVDNSNSAPYINEVVEGRMPKAEGREVAVSKLFVEKANLKLSDVIGKTLDLTGTTFDWSSAEPKEVKNNIDGLTIVGVIDTKASYTDPKYGKMELESEDSFIYGLDVVKEIKGQSNSSQENISFTIRVKDIKDVMPIVNELRKDGITALGEFETVSDILSINNTTKEQSGAITVIIAAIAVVVTLAVTLINAILRKREFAILKINGYSKASIFNLNITENLLIAASSIVIFVVASPVINNVSNKIFSMSVSGSKSMITGIMIILIQGIIMGIISALITSNIKAENNIMTGDR